MLNFSSINFSKLYLDTYLPLSIKIRHLRMTNKYFELLDHIDRVVQCVNDNGDWIVVGWYKHGVINDHTLIGNSNNTSGNNNNNNNENVCVDNGEINYHVVEVLLTNHNLVISGTALYQRLSGLKYHVQGIRGRAY
eukprot:3722836-Ditylum_brightwellii.AAC.1